MNILQDGYFLQVDVFMPGAMEMLQSQLGHKFAQESVFNLNKHHKRYIFKKCFALFSIVGLDLETVSNQYNMSQPFAQYVFVL